VVTIVLAFIAWVAAPVRQTEGPVQASLITGKVSVATPKPTPVPTPKPTLKPPPAHVAEVPSHPAVPTSPAFWRALANCESADGSDKVVRGVVVYVGYFQFAPGTWAATGGGPKGSYEHQRSRAILWATRLVKQRTSPGSRSGWPVCWWVALRRSKAA
jgi:hypothetical protein